MATYKILEPKFKTVLFQTKSVKTRAEIIRKLNEDGYFVSIDLDDAESGKGAYFNAFSNYEFKYSEPLDDYFEEIMHCDVIFITPLTEAQKKDLLENMFVDLGYIGPDKVEANKNSIRVGDYEITKKEAIAFAKTILKHFS